jgi:hypothetical protein
MKKVTIPLPDWVDEKHLRVFAGIELVAIKEHGQEWEIKDERCNYCGKCCMNMEPHTPFATVEGRCMYLKLESTDRYVCSLNADRPFGCCASEPMGREYCCVTRRIVDEAEML